MTSEPLEGLTKQQIWERAQHRYQDDAEFHARVHATGKLLGFREPSILAWVVHAADLATEMLNLGRDLQQELSSQREDRVITSLELHEVSLVAHRKGPDCIDLDEQHPVCTGCGVGFVKVLGDHG